MQWGSTIVTLARSPELSTMPIVDQLRQLHECSVTYNRNAKECMCGFCSLDWKLGTGIHTCAPNYCHTTYITSVRRAAIKTPVVEVHSTSHKRAPGMGLVTACIETIPCIFRRRYAGWLTWLLNCQHNSCCENTLIAQRGNFWRELVPSSPFKPLRFVSSMRSWPRMTVSTSTVTKFN